MSLTYADRLSVLDARISLCPVEGAWRWDGICPLCNATATQGDIAA